MIPQVMVFLWPIYIPQALNTGICIQQGHLFYSAGLHRKHVLATANTGEIWRGFGKNAGEENDRERGRDEWDERGGVVLN